MHASVTVIGLMLSCVLGGPEKPKPAAKEVPIPREDLRYDGKSFEQWRRNALTELKAEKLTEALIALRAFAAKGYAAEAAATVIDLMGADEDWVKEGKWEVVRQAHQVIVRAGPAAQPALLRALKEQNKNRRLFALQLFFFEDVPFAFALATIGDLALDSNKEVREKALGFLGVRSEKKGVLDALARCLSEGDVDVRCAALEEIAGDCKGKADDPLLNLALCGLRDKEEAVRLSAVKGLGRLLAHHDPDRDAGDPLYGSRNSPTAEAREAYQKLIAVILRGTKNSPGLLVSLKDPSVKVRLEVIVALTEFTKPHPETSPPEITRALKEAANDNDPTVRRAAAQALSKPTPPSLLPARALP